VGVVRVTYLLRIAETTSESSFGHNNPRTENKSMFVLEPSRKALFGKGSI